jgi:hypothetical protein
MRYKIADYELKLPTIEVFRVDTYEDLNKLVSDIKMFPNNYVLVDTRVTLPCYVVESSNDKKHVTTDVSVTYGRLDSVPAELFAPLVIEQD